MEVFKLGEEFKGAVGVVDGGEDFAAVADDAGVEDEAFDVGVVEFCDFVEVEVGEGGAEVFAFAEDGEPGEAGLESFEADFFVEAEIVGDSPAPFLVVVFDILFVVAAPPAAGEAVGTGDEAVFGRGHEGSSEKRARWEKKKPPEFLPRAFLPIGGLGSDLVLGRELGKGLEDGMLAERNPLAFETDLDLVTAAKMAKFHKLLGLHLFGFVHKRDHFLHHGEGSRTLEFFTGGLDQVIRREMGRSSSGEPAAHIGLMHERLNDLVIEANLDRIGLHFGLRWIWKACSREGSEDLGFFVSEAHRDETTSDDGGCDEGVGGF